jgi:hypothetical protein
VQRTAAVYQRRLLDAGDVPYGRTALHLACWSGQADGVAALLAAGADLRATTGVGAYIGQYRLLLL